MILIRPKHINDSYLVSSNVAETDYTAWSGATTYAVGDRAIVVSPASTVTMTIAAPVVVTWAAHGLIAGDIVVFTTTGALPTGLTAGQHYYVTPLTTGTFTVSASKTGAPVTTSGSQSGTHTATASTHKVYESLLAGNLNNVPRNSPTWWLDIGATNRWKMFDQSPSSQTSNGDSIAVTLNPSGICDSVALLNISAASARFRMTDTASGVTVTMTIASPCVVTETGHTRVDGDMLVLSTTDTLPTGLTAGTTYYVVNAATNTYELSETSGGTAIGTSGSQAGVHTAKEVLYDTTYSMNATSGVIDWFAYYYEPIVRARDKTEIEMPRIGSPTIDITLTDTGNTVLCGACIIGQRMELGTTVMGLKTGITDYSIKQQDDFGNYTVLERAFRKRADYTAWVEAGRVGAVQDTLSDFRATPIVYIGTEAYTNAIVYGFYRDFNIDIAYETHSVCTLNIEGLT